MTNLGCRGASPHSTEYGKGVIFVMISISLCMIVKDEEDVLERCLASVYDIVDEIIIVDTGSADNTKEIAARYTDKIFDFEWVDDFSKARNYAFSQAKSDYCMWLDADDVIEPEDRQKLNELKKQLSDTVDIVMMKYNTAFDEEGNPTFLFYRERLIKNFQGFVWEGEIHEVITPRGNIVYSDIAVTHKKEHIKNPARNLEIFEKMIKRGKIFSPREMFYYARELYYNGFYEKSAEIFDEFLNMPDGWIQNKKEACRFLYLCYSEQNFEDRAIRALFKSFEYDVPEAVICCEIGSFFFKKQEYKIAEYWYKSALDMTPNAETGAFTEPDYYGFIPSIQLCLCYYYMNDLENAVLYNEKAGEYKPNSGAYLNNKTYFENLKKEQ